MIVAVEGPDCSGKTTLWEALQGKVEAIFVKRPPLTPEQMSRARELELEDLELWEREHDPSGLYIADRHTAVSALAYGALYGREPLDTSSWVPRLRVVYLRPTAAQLRARLLERGDSIADPERAAELLAAYDAAVKGFQCLCFAGGWPIEALVEVSLLWIG